MSVSVIGRGEEIAFHEGSEIVARNGCSYVRSRDAGGFIKIDRVGEKILRSLPSSTDRLYESLAKNGLCVPRKLLNFYVLLFWKCGVVRVEGLAAVDPKESIDDHDTVDKPKVSVILVARAEGDSLRPSLREIASQTTGPDEVIVVDRGGLAKDAGMAVDGHDVKFVRTRSARSYAAAVNAGMKAAGGDLMVVLAESIQLPHDFIEVIIRRYLEAGSHVAGIVPQQRAIKNRPFTWGIGMFMDASVRCQGNYRGALDLGQFEQIETVGSPSFRSVAVTRNAWERVGPLDERYSECHDGADWSLRAHLQGLEFLAAPRALAYCDESSSSVAGRQQVAAVKSRYRFILKNLTGKYRLGRIRDCLKEDKRSIYQRCGAAALIRVYIGAFVGILIELPGIVYYAMMRGKVERETLLDFFEKNKPHDVLVRSDFEPTINRQVIRSYYYFL